MNFHIITIFPQILDSYFNESIIKRAQKNKIIDIKVHNLRDWTADKHKTVDDAPYGGGAGMVMKIEPIFKALQALNFQFSPRLRSGQAIFNFQKNTKKNNSKSANYKSKIILLSAKGKTWNQQLAKKYSQLDNIVFVCGRYEGIDERVRKLVDEEISIGDYVLTGGELGAAVIIDSITRLLPGALGNCQSSQEESHALTGVLEYPQYTRPEIFTISPLKMGARGVSLRVPKVLLSGNHEKIKAWRKRKMKKINN